MEKITHRLIFAIAIFCSSTAFAEVEEVHVYGTKVTYEYMPFDKWVKQEMSLVGGAHAQVTGSAYSNYRAGLAKNAYCAQIKADRVRCRENVLTMNAGAVEQCTQLKSFTTTMQIGADGKIVNGNVAVTITFDNKDDCYRVTDAYKDAALASCDATLADLKVQTAKQGFCL